MKFDKEVNEQVDEENQTQEGRAKKGTSNAKNYTSRCTGLGLHKIFAALPEEEKGALRATYFVPLLLIDPIATMSTLAVEIFNHHLENVLRLNLIKIILSFLLPNKGRNVEGWRMTSFKRRQIVTFKKFFANPDLLVITMMPSETDMQQDLVQEAMKYQIKVFAIGVALTIGVPTISSSSSATEIRDIVVRVCSQLEGHGKMLERILMSIVGDSTLPLGDTLLLWHYQFSTPEKTAKRKREQKKEEDRKRKKAEPRIKKAKNLLQQVTPGEMLEVANALMVDDDVEVGREWKKGEEKDNNDKKDVEEKVKSEEEEVQEMEESKNGDEKVDGDEKLMMLLKKRIQNNQL
ncbi:hypothetical protein GIB67_039413 [Kingdonia uniflora]|uniref:Uncharacterized protein n=1 Tax=Kingdonia uniflora TaxID=39325 RepID=A0A7J7LIS2_9MAGN|nr:hypothetical protein GIB67_039413 [Kingdonia uniflora]